MGGPRYPRQALRGLWSAHLDDVGRRTAMVIAFPVGPLDGMRRDPMPEMNVFITFAGWELRTD